MVDGSLNFQSLRSRFLRASGVTFVFTASARLLNFLGMTVLLAHYFGASRETDALFLTSALPVAIITTLFSSAVNYLFISVFNEASKVLGRKAGERVALGIFAWALAVIGTLAICAASGARPLVGILAPGFDPATQSTAVILIRLFCLWMVLATINALLQNTFYARQCFLEPGAASLLPPLGMVIALLLLAETHGVTSILIGQISGAALQVIVQLYLLRRRCQFDVMQRPFMLDTYVRRMLSLSLPIVVGTMAFPAYIVVTRILASRLEPGSLTSLELATKVVEGLSFLLIQPSSAAIAPSMAIQSVKSDRAGLASSLNMSASWLATFLFPIGFGLILLRNETASLLFGRGALSPEALGWTAQALAFLALSMFIQPLNSMNIQTLYASQRTYSLLAGNLAGVVGGIVSAILLTQRFGLPGLAVSIPVAYLCQAVTLVLRSRYLVGFPDLDLMASLIKVAVAAGISAWIFSFVINLELLKPLASVPLAAATSIVFYLLLLKVVAPQVLAPQQFGERTMT